MRLYGGHEWPSHPWGGTLASIDITLITINFHEMPHLNYTTNLCNTTQGKQLPYTYHHLLPCNYVHHEKLDVFWVACGGSVSAGGQYRGPSCAWPDEPAWLRGGGPCCSAGSLVLSPTDLPVESECEVIHSSLV